MAFKSMLRRKGVRVVSITEHADDSPTGKLMEAIIESSLRGNGLKKICKELNDRGITNRGNRWYKGGLHYLLTNEAYTGTAVWGRISKGEKAQDPVRVEGAWPALVSRELFDAVQQAMRDRAPKVQRPARVGSKFLLSGLLKCGVCGRPYSGQGAKSGQYGYYICGTLFREGAGTCSARYLNAPRVEDFIVEKVLDFVQFGGECGIRARRSASHYDLRGLILGQASLDANWSFLSESRGLWRFPLRCT